MSNLVKCSSCNLVINEVLAFISNKMDVMDEESISRICVTAFTESEIECAKNLLCESIPSDKRKKTRKRQGKSVRNIDDIICLLKETDPEEIPTFVARELHKLPPVLFDHVDVTRLLKDLVKMRSEIDRITEEYATVKQLDALKLDFEDLKTASVVNNFQRNNSHLFRVNTKRGACVLNSLNCDSGPIGLTHMFENNDLARSHCSTSTPTQLLFQEKRTLEGSNVANQSCTDLNESLAYQNKSAVSGQINNVNGMTHQTTTTALVTCPAPSIKNATGHTVATVESNLNKQNKKLLSKIVQEGEWKPEVPNDEWIRVQRKKLRNRFTGSRGKADVGSNNNFKAADVKIPLFIYNVSKETSMCDIENYIRKKSNMTVVVQKVDMKMTKDYNSYKVFVPKDNLKLFLSDDFWPNGVAYRRFFDFSRNKRNEECRK